MKYARAILGATLLSSMLATPRVVTAAEPRTAILPVQAHGVDEATVSIIEQVLADKLIKAGWAVVGTADTSALAAEVCSTPSCDDLEQVRAIGVATGAGVVVSVSMQAGPDGIEVALTALSTVSGEAITKTASTTLAGLLAATAKLIYEAMPDPSSLAPVTASPLPPGTSPFLAGQPDKPISVKPISPPDKSRLEGFPPCDVWNEAWDLYARGRSLLVPGIIFAAAGFAEIFLTTMFWAVPSSVDADIVEPGTGAFLVTMGGAAMLAGGLMIGFGAKNNSLSLDLWAGRTTKAIQHPPVDCSPSFGDPGFAATDGRIQTLRSASKGLILPGSIMMGLGLLFGTADVALVIDSDIDWHDEAVRIYFTMSMVFGAAGLALLSAGLGLRAKARKLYRGELSALPVFGIGMAPSGHGTFVSATWTF